MRKLLALLLMTYSSSVVTMSYEKASGFRSITDAKEQLAQELLCDEDRTRWNVVRDGDVVMIWGECRL